MYCFFSKEMSKLIRCGSILLDDKKLLEFENSERLLLKLSSGDVDTSRLSLRESVQNEK